MHETTIDSVKNYTLHIIFNGVDLISIANN